jgi:hypothetical protein
MKLKQGFDPKRFPPLQDHFLKLGLGSFLILITLLGLINQGIVAFIINVFFGYLIGQLRFLGYLFFIGYGLALLFNRPFLKVKPSLTLFGALIASLSLLALSTLNGLAMMDPTPTLSFANFFTIFSQQFPPLNTGAIEIPSSVGGGIIGYALVTLFEVFNLSSIQSVIWITLLIVGIALALELVWLQFIRFGSKQMDLRQKEKAYFQKISETRPAGTKLNVYAEPTETGQEMKTFRGMFSRQNVPGLSKVPFQKPTANNPNQPTSLTPFGQVDFKDTPIQTSSLSSTYEAPEVPEQATENLVKPGLAKVVTSTKTPSSGNRYQAYQ